MYRLPLFASALMLVAFLFSGMVAAAQEGTPAPLPRVPDPSECQVEPRSIESLQGIAGTPVLGTPGAGTPAGEEALEEEAVLPASPAAELLTEGEPADEATVAGIEATVTEVLACFNAGDFLRAFALYSDELISRDFGTIPEEDIAFLEASPVAVAEEQQLTLVSIENVRVLEDGRAVAIVTVDEPDGAVEGPESVLLVFTQQDDRWVIDEFIELPDVGTPAAGTPAA